MANHKCVHLCDNRLDKGDCTPHITLCISGAKWGLVLCPECYTVVNKGEKLVTKIPSKRRNRAFIITKSNKSQDPIFFEVRTDVVSE